MISILVKSGPNRVFHCISSDNSVLPDIQSEYVYKCLDRIFIHNRDYNIEDRIVMPTDYRGQKVKGQILTTMQRSEVT